MTPSRKQSLPYQNPDRLSDVMALIQVLALHTYADRTENGLQTDLQGPPRSASQWKEIASQHPEFFRVNESREHAVALVARHVLPRNEDGDRQLESDFVERLLNTAIELHDRQLDRLRYWKVYIPIIVAMTPASLLCLVFY